MCVDCTYDLRLDERSPYDPYPDLDGVHQEVTDEKRGRIAARVTAHKRACAQTDEEQKEARRHGLYG